MKQLDIQEYTGVPVFIDNSTAEGEASDPTPNTYVKICRNGLFRCSKNGMMESIVKLEGIGGVLNEGKENAVWCGPKLSLEDFHFIKALFIKIYNMIQTECDVQLEYSQTLGKIIIRLPHQTVSGTHVSWEAQDDDVFWVDRKRVELKDLPTDIEHIGRVHSHNVMSAFWSSVDTGDQERQERGIQIVMGKITTEFEYKCRIANCGKFYDCEPQDVLDIPPVVMPEVPEGIIKVVTPAYTSTTTTQHPAGYSSTTWFSGSVWDSKLKKYVMPAKTSENVGGTAANGGGFHKQDSVVAGGSTGGGNFWGGRYGYGDYDYEGPSYNPHKVEEDNVDPFSKGGHAKVIRVIKPAAAKTENKTQKTAADKTTQPHPISYLISGLIAPEFMKLRDEELLPLAEGFDDPIKTALDCHVGNPELRKVLCFEAYHQALFAEPTDLSNMTPSEVINEFDVVFKAAQAHSSEPDVVADCLKSSSLNLTHAVRCFRTWYPVLSSEFASYLYQRFKISLNNVGNIVWSPKMAAVRSHLDETVGMLMDIEEAAFDSGFMMFPYIVATQFSEKKDRQDYLLRLIKEEAL